MAQSPSVQNYPMTSLYVGDLHSDVTEAQLLKKISSVGPVQSLHLCRDIVTRQSRGYAYVNFYQPADAERALDTMNYVYIKGRPIRIMWTQRDPSLRKFGVGNVFVKNLDKNIISKDLHNIFSVFGKILSCKVAQDDNGESKGYGFVHFETEEAATKSIDKMNGMMLREKKIFAGKFVAKKRREAYEKVKFFTNVYVKNFGEDFTNDMLKEMFEKYGLITSHIVIVDKDEKSRGFGFVAFKDPESAEKAVDELNGKKTAEGKMLYVRRAQRKAERQQEMNKKYQGLNLYIRNIDHSIDDERLRKEFGPYGTITSVKVMLDNGKSKGVGFVCFSSREEATKALTEMNGRIVGAKPIYVSLAQRKEDRKAHILHSRYVQYLVYMRMQQMGQIFESGTTSGYCVPTLPQPQRFYGPGQIAYARPQTISAGQPNVRPNAQIEPAGFPNMHGGQLINAPRPCDESHYRFTASMRNHSQPMAQKQRQQQPPQAQPQQAIYIQGHEPLTTAMLTAAGPKEQKNMLGTRLYQLIRPMHPDLAGKITGILLHLDNADLLFLLEDHSTLNFKVEEAVALLQT